MSFILKPISSIKEKITILVPKDLGRTSKSEITVEFKKLSVSAAKQLMESSANGDLNDDEALEENIVDISGLLDESGNKIDYTVDLLSELLDMEYVRRPITKKFMEVIIGKEALKAKN
jgi:hypothetical protein